MRTRPRPLYERRVCAIVCEAVKELGATIVIGSATALGKELCASVAARLGVELVQDCTELKWDNGLTAVKPIYAGKVIANVRVTDTPAIASLRPNVAAVVREGDAQPEVVRRGIPAGSSVRTILKEAVEAPPGTIELTEAKKVVSGGRGLAAPKRGRCCRRCAMSWARRWAPAAPLWMPAGFRTRIKSGQTGKVVSPDVYIACGISGAIQHQAGMRPRAYRGH